MTALWVFVGGGLGSVLRWGVSLWTPQPWATLAVNVLGSLILAYLAHPGTWSDGPMKTAVCTGLLGGFTTYSTFNLEVLKLLDDGRPGAAAVQVLLTVVLALAAGGLGWWLASRS